MASKPGASIKALHAALAVDSGGDGGGGSSSVRSALWQCVADTCRRTMCASLKTVGSRLGGRAGVLGCCSHIRADRMQGGRVRRSHLAVETRSASRLLSGALTGLSCSLAGVMWAAAGNPLADGWRHVAAACGGGSVALTAVCRVFSRAIDPPIAPEQLCAVRARFACEFEGKKAVSGACLRPESRPKPSLLCRPAACIVTLEP